jgi:hypothetical protein
MIITDAIDNEHLYEDVFKGFYEWGEKFIMKEFQHLILAQN